MTPNVNTTNSSTIFVLKMIILEMSNHSRNSGTPAPTCMQNSSESYHKISWENTAYHISSTAASQILQSICIIEPTSVRESDSPAVFIWASPPDDDGLCLSYKKIYLFYIFKVVYNISVSLIKKMKSLLQFSIILILSAFRCSLINRGSSTKNNSSLSTLRREYSLENRWSI